MKRVSVTDLKNRLSEYLRLVKRGESIEVVDRSVPVARLLGVAGRAAGDSNPLDHLVREGVLSPARGKPPLELLRQPPVPCRADAVQALIDERGDR